MLNPYMRARIMRTPCVKKVPAGSCQGNGALGRLTRRQNNAAGITPEKEQDPGMISGYVFCLRLRVIRKQFCRAQK